MWDVSDFLRGYSSQWNGTISNTFSTSNGVKQGGVLSPILFNVYLDELIKMLSEKGLGCHLHGQ